MFVPFPSDLDLICKYFFQAELSRAILQAFYALQLQGNYFNWSQGLATNVIT